MKYTTSSDTAPGPYLYEDLQIGTKLPAVNFRVTEELIDGYLEATGDTSPLFSPRQVGRRPAPPMLATVYTRPAFAAIQPPPGAVLIRQTFRFASSAFEGDVLRTEASIAGKYIRKETRYVDIDTVTTNQEGNFVATGRITRIWPE